MDTVYQIIFGCVAIAAFYGFNRLTNRKRRYFLKNGLPGKANIIDIQKTLISYGSGSFRRPLFEIVLEIEPAKTHQERVTIKQAFEPRTTPKVCDKVNVLIDPRDNNKVLILSDQNGNIL